MEHALPFGKHRGRPPREVPSDYLAWLLRETKLSSGLRAAVAGELRQRGWPVPDEPPPEPSPCCRHCGGTALRRTWHEHAGGARQVRGDCARCGKYVAFLPLTPANVAAADLAQSPAALLDVLTRAEDEGVDLVVQGGRVVPQPWGRASPLLRERIRQAQHALLRHLRKASQP